MSINDLKAEMKKSPKFLRTIRSNKAPIILDKKFGMDVEPYNAIDKNILIKKNKITILKWMYLNKFLIYELVNLL